jgi:hypothetical protein
MSNLRPRPSCLSWELKNFDLPKRKAKTNPDSLTFLSLLRTQELRSYQKESYKQTRILWPSCLYWELRNLDLFPKRKLQTNPDSMAFVKCIMKSGKYSLFCSFLPFFPLPPPRAFCFQTWDPPKRRSVPNDDRSFDLQNYHLRTFQTKIDLYTLDLPKIRWSISRPPKRD